MMIQKKFKVWVFLPGLFVAWISLLVLAYWYFIVKPQQWFDDSMMFPHRLYMTEEQKALRELIQKQFPELEDDAVWFVRFKQSHCGCERFVELYHQAFARQSEHQVVSLDLDSSELKPYERRQLQQWVSATPAALVFQANGELAYFGPYHQEGVCNADNSYLEPVLRQLNQGQQPSIINTLVYGCFCSVS